MILLNFSHPITDAQRAQIEMLTGQPLVEQMRELVEGVGLTCEEWQTKRL